MWVALPGEGALCAPVFGLYTAPFYDDFRLTRFCFSICGGEQLDAAGYELPNHSERERMDDLSELVGLGVCGE